MVFSTSQCGLRLSPTDRRDFISVFETVGNSRNIQAKQSFFFPARRTVLRNVSYNTPGTNTRANISYTGPG